MAYVPDATNIAEPLDTRKASSAAAEFRTLKTYIANSIPKLAADNQFTQRMAIGGAPTANTRLTINHTAYGALGAGLSILNTTAGAAAWIAAGFSNSTDADCIIALTQVGAASKYAAIGPTINIPLYFRVAGDVLRIENDGMYPVGDNLKHLGAGGLRFATVHAVTFNGSLNGNASSATGADRANALNNADLLSQRMDFRWQGQPGQPSWLWGSNDGNQHYVYNPANFNVNQANQVANALSISGTGLTWGGGTYNGSAAKTLSIQAGTNGYGVRNVNAGAPDRKSVV